MLSSFVLDLGLSQVLLVLSFAKLGSFRSEDLPSFGERLHLFSGGVPLGSGDVGGCTCTPIIGIGPDGVVRGFCGLSLMAPRLVVVTRSVCVLDSRGCITFREKSSYDDFIFLSTMFWMYLRRSSYLEKM